jgi:hypothetical protein
MSFCTFLPISIKRRQTFSRNDITLSTSASLGSLSSGSPGLAPDGPAHPVRAAHGPTTPFQGRVLALQAGNLGLQRRAFIGHYLADPSAVAPAAVRDLAAASVEPQHAIRHRIETVAAGASRGSYGSSAEEQKRDSLVR